MKNFKIIINHLVLFIIYSLLIKIVEFIIEICKNKKIIYSARYPIINPSSAALISSSSK